MKLHPFSRGQDRQVTPGTGEHSTSPDLSRNYHAKAENFTKTLKCEDVYLRQYRGREEVHASDARFIDEVYNRKRLHSSLGYRSSVASGNQCRPRHGNFLYEFSQACVPLGRKTVSENPAIS